MRKIVVAIFVSIFGFWLVIGGIEGTEGIEHVDQNAGKKSTLEETFGKAVQAYLEEDWNDCIEYFNEAIHRYKMHRRTVVNCRRKCKGEASRSSPSFPENIDDMHFYEQKLRETLCLLKCKQMNKDRLEYEKSKGFPKELEVKLLNLGPYEYLHICYYQKKRHGDAANAIFTYMMRHPEHLVSVENMKFYLGLPDVRQEELVDLEAPDFLESYVAAVRAYEQEFYEEAVHGFEDSLASYLEAEDACRIYCEGPFDQGWHHEFASSVANHFTYCLKCKRWCADQLNYINGEYRKDLLSSHYDYLQFAYYKLGKLKDACAAVESFLLFKPADETMLHNKDYYGRLPHVTKDLFVPRKEAVAYIKRHTYEWQIFHFINEEFSKYEATYLRNDTKREDRSDGRDFAIKEKETEQAGKQIPRNSSRATFDWNSNYFGNESPMLPRSDDVERVSDSHESETGSGDDDEEEEEEEEAFDVKLVAVEEELGGRDRYVADGLLNSTECISLLELARIAAVEGDGYEAFESPHSKYERFEGVTVGRAALLAYYGVVEADLLELLLGKSEAAAKHVARYFNLDRELYFTYTHLVCRASLAGSPSIRDDLSHRIHADNCVLSYAGDGQVDCRRESPAYVWREYSAIVYLNEDFEGGAFFFANVERGVEVEVEVEARVQPRCGRLLGFSAGGENPHGVEAVLAGRRCALALWFTLDRDHLEYERLLARVVLRRIRSGRPLLRDRDHLRDTRDTSDSRDTTEYSHRIPFRYEDSLSEAFREDPLLRELLRYYA